MTIIAARFMPFLRTFAPFVAGVAQMTRSRFTLYDVTGGALWIGSITLAGYLFGNIPWVKEQPRQDHLGRDPDSRPARPHRGVASADEAAEDDLSLRAAADAASALGALAFAATRGALAAGSGCELTEQACCW